MKELLQKPDLNIPVSQREIFIGYFKKDSNMYRTYFFYFNAILRGCHVQNSTSKVGEDQQSSQQIEYVMNDSLSTDFIY